MKINKNFTDKETFKPRPELSTGVTMKTSGGKTSQGEELGNTKDSNEKYSWCPEKIEDYIPGKFIAWFQFFILMIFSLNF